MATSWFGCSSFMELLCLRWWGWSPSVDTFFLAGVAGSDGEIATCIIETLQLERRPASKGSQVQCLLPKGCHRQQNNATNVIIIKRIEISSPIVWGLMLAAGKVYLIITRFFPPSSWIFNNISCHHRMKPWLCTIQDVLNSAYSSCVKYVVFPYACPRYYYISFYIF